MHLASDCWSKPLGNPSPHWFRSFVLLFPDFSSPDALSSTYQRRKLFLMQWFTLSTGPNRTTVITCTSLGAVRELLDHHGNLNRIHINEQKEKNSAQARSRASTLWFQQCSISMPSIPCNSSALTIIENISQSAGFEPALPEGIWFRVRRLNHSATTAPLLTGICWVARS